MSMNNDLEQFSEERLEDIVEFRAKPTPLDGVLLARISLAAKQAKPVAWLLSGGGAKNVISFDSSNAYADPLREVTPLYTTPQPAHTEQVIPSEIPKVPHNGVMAYKKDGSIYSTNYARGWNDCVKAMLRAAPKPESE